MKWKTCNEEMADSLRARLIEIDAAFSTPDVESVSFYPLTTHQVARIQKIEVLMMLVEQQDRIIEHLQEAK